jgi:CelD/BcsL family acetyltransferase involved in cellulose biosynthesis
MPMTMLAVDDPRWLDFVQSRPEASIFHHPAWARLLADCYGYRPFVLALCKGNDVTAGLPVLDVTWRLGGRRWVSLPFSDWCPALSTEGPAELVAAMHEAARSARVDVLELRGPLPEDPSVQSGATFVRHELALDEPADMWRRLSQNHRRNLRAAERAGVRVTQGASASDLDTFYRLHLQTRRRLGVPVQPRGFFALLLERIIQPGLGVVFTAYVDDVPAAAAVFAVWNGTVVYKYGARDERFAKDGANHLLFWTAIQWARSRGDRCFDLGRTALDQSELGRFKSGWGAREELLAYSWIAAAPIKVSSRRLEAAMSVVIRNSAPWLCRAMGELFYRYAA